MRRQALRSSLLLVCVVLVAPACATRGGSEAHSGIAPLWGEFVEAPPERALALAGDPDRRWVGAVAGGHASQIEAEENALAECRRRRQARRMRAPCRLYASGGEIVWETR